MMDGKNPNLTIRIAKIAGISGLALLGIFILTVALVQFSTFTVKPQVAKDMDGYLAERDLFSSGTGEIDRISIFVPTEILNEELRKQILNRKEAGIHNLEVDFMQERVSVNYRVSGFYVPIRYVVVPDFSGTEIRFSLQPKSLGSIGLPLPKWSYRMLNSILKTELHKGISIASEQMVKQGLQMKSWTIRAGGIEAEYRLRTELFHELVQSLKALKHNDLWDLFAEGGFEEKKLVTMLSAFPGQPEELERTLMEGFSLENSMMERFLLLLNAELREKAFTYFPFLHRFYHMDNIAKKRSSRIASTVTGYGRSILQSARQWQEMTGGIYFNQGYPFLKEDLRTVSVKEVVETWDLDIPESVVRKMHFGVDYAVGKPSILYPVDEKIFAVIQDEADFVVDQKTYEARYYQPFPKAGELTKSPEIWNQIVAKLKEMLSTEEVFIRYLKEDGEHAFVLASFLEKPQDIQTLTFAKMDGKWLPTAGNFKDFDELAQKDIRFNFNLYTDRYEKPNLIYVDSNALRNIEEELEYAGKLRNGEKPVYYSYKDKYVSVRLSDGAEYVLTTYHQYLDKIFTKKQAIELYKDALPAVILLQDAPGSEQEGTSN